MRTISIALCILGVTVAAHAQSLSKKWKEGRYYDTTRHCHAGLIYYPLPGASLFKGKGHYLLFKNDTNSEEQKIITSEISSFVLERDSFIVSHSKMIEKFPVLKVVVNNPVKLYNSLVISPGRSAHGMPEGSKGSSTYYYGTNPNDLTVITRKNFAEAMSKIMSDKPGVIGKIEDKTFKYSTIKSLITYYLTGVLP